MKNSEPKRQILFMTFLFIGYLLIDLVGTVVDLQNKANSPFVAKLFMLIKDSPIVERLIVIVILIYVMQAVIILLFWLRFRIGWIGIVGLSTLLLLVNLFKMRALVNQEIMTTLVQLLHIALFSFILWSLSQVSLLNTYRVNIQMLKKVVITTVIVMPCLWLFVLYIAWTWI